MVQNNQKKSDQGLSIIEILVAIAIVSVVGGFSIAMFGNSTSKNSLEKEVSDLVAVAGLAQSYANSANSKNCADNDRLSRVSLTKESETDYKVYMTCEYNFLVGTPTLSPTKPMDPPISKNLKNAQFDSAMTPNGDLMTFLPGALTTPGPTIAIMSGQNCACVKVDTNGIISVTEKKNCSVSAGAVSCIW